MSHPEKYTEAFMATKVVKPLLDVLAYLHSANVVHRAIFPEYVMFGREDKLKLGHFTSAIDQRVDPPAERIPFLDYMAPEMLSVRTEEAAAAPLVLPPAPQLPGLGPRKVRHSGSGERMNG
jgi:serine/threonine protein kinase